MKKTNRSLFLRFFLASAATMFVVWIGALLWEAWGIHAFLGKVQEAEAKGWTRQILAGVSSPGLTDAEIRRTVRKIEELRDGMYGEIGFTRPRWRLRVWRGGTLVYGDKEALDAQALLAGAHEESDRKWFTRTESDPAAGVTVQLAQEFIFAWHFSLAGTSYKFAPLLYCFPFLLLTAWLTIRYGLRPLREVVRQIDNRSATDLSPLPAPAHRELAPLIESTNQLMSRLLERLHREQEFLVDAAHQLKTPLAIVQSNAELLVDARSDAVAIAARDGLREGIADAAHVVHQLLALARSETQAGAEALAALDLAELIRDRLAFAAGMAMPRGVEIDFDAPESCMARLARASTAALIDNLMSNAIKYSPDGGRVSVRLTRHANTIELSVADEGPGIPEEMREKVFERFFRLPDQDRSGSGLGLAIAERAAARNMARVSLHGREQGTGLVARVDFLQHVAQS